MMQVCTAYTVCIQDRTVLPSCREGTDIFVENYYPQVTRDIRTAEEALKSPLPDAVREALQEELKKLQALLAVLDGQQEKNPLSTLRAELRWRRRDLQEAKEPAERKRIEQELVQIQNSIKQHSKSRRK